MVLLPVVSLALAVTGNCIKRKVRDWVALAPGTEERYQI